MSEFFAQPDDLGDIRASELHVGYGERLGAQAGEAFMGGVRTVGRAIQYGFAGGEAMPGLNMPDMPSMADLELNQQIRAEIPDTPIADAKARVKQEGLEGHLKLPEQDSIKGPVLDLMINHAHERRQYDAAIARGPQGFIPDALGFVTEIGAGMIDPVNAAAFSMPVLGEARLGMMMARAGDSLAARAGVKAAAGAAQGAAGSTALLPADWALHTRDGQDYTMAQALRSVVLGAGMGAAAHAGIGLFRDVRARGRGEPLEGSPEDLLARGLMGGTHVQGSALAEEGVPAHEVPGIGSDLPPPEGAGGEVGPPVHPAEILADLPPRVRENVTQAAIADVIADRPVRAGEMLEIAGQQDPRIAESIEAWHGSPHDFEAFDINKIGQGEGAQAYGHGLYFAQEESVARSYQLMGDATVDGRPYDLNNPLHKASSLIDEHGSRAGAIADAKARQQHDPGDFYGDVLRHLESDRELPKIETAGRMYRVRIKADPEHMLDWDKNAREQPAGLDAAYREAGLDLSGATTGEDAYRQLLEHFRAGKIMGEYAYAGRQVSELLARHGITGIKYLDQGSRFTESDAKAGLAAIRGQIAELEHDIALHKDKPGILPAYFARRDADIAELRTHEARIEKRIADRTRNFVVFNDADIEITHKNGEPVTRAEIAAAHEPAQDNVAPLRRPATPNADAWRKLADQRDPDAANDLAESREAAATPELASVDPVKAPSAAEKAAAEADKLLDDIKSKLTEAERARFDEVLAVLSQDKEARDQVVRDGAACLLEAAG